MLPVVTDGEPPAGPPSGMQPVSRQQTAARRTAVQVGAFVMGTPLIYARGLARTARPPNATHIGDLA